ncbi:hypothetical protein AB6N23_06890 [Cellulomonas sp. 179-A 9B4 NHS]|uniref:hypothetical protein n=1 Tax=Cellulomonas sp. 179-A 9B4 NHS TaxID=3142379 RepID=UPI0039A0042B
MNAATATATPHGVPPATARTGPRFGRVVAAERTKLVSLRSPWWTAAVTVVVAGVITYLSAEASSGDPGFVPVDSLSTGLMLAQVGPLVLGVLAGAGEFRTGAFRTSFTAVPRRWPVLVAQTLVVAAFALVTAVLAAAASVVGILPAAASRGIAVDLVGGDTPGLLLGMVLFVVGLALLGLALGALLRRTLPALLAALSLALVLPVVLMTVGDPGTDAMGMAVPHRVTVPGALGTFTPGGAAQLMTTSTSAGPMPGSPDLGPVGGGLVLAAWVVLLLVVALVRLRARDAR